MFRDEAALIDAQPVQWLNVAQYIRRGQAVVTIENDVSLYVHIDRSTPTWLMVVLARERDRRMKEKRVLRNASSRR